MDFANANLAALRHDLAKQAVYCNARRQRLWLRVCLARTGCPEAIRLATTELIWIPFFNFLSPLQNIAVASLKKHFRYRRISPSRQLLGCTCHHNRSTKMAKIIRMRESAARLGIARSTLYDWQNPLSPRYDNSLPQRVKLGLSAAGFIEEELDAWIDRQKTAEKR